ncbi:hypothetical protein [Thalassotalea maritima]|uniref:TackOD1 domain-containing metal-binding protein n=1 Tax=Thalassotalea maritima TaxID=3242416 RepID=UPI003528FB56
MNISRIAEDDDVDLTNELFHAAVIDVDDKSVVNQWLITLRSDSEHFAIPIFVTTEAFAEIPMVDGLVPPSIDIAIKKYQARLDDCKLEAEQNLEARLLIYLWAVAERSLKAHCQTDHDVSYVYPFLDIWDDGIGKELWLERLCSAGLLVKEKLIDRLRQCHSCGSSLLNYVDCCPDCHSIDLKIERALHCFTCGHVGEQQTFVRTGEMVCPNCLTKLRHIGTDYDRPIENKRCNACDNFFIEADVRAHCFSCHYANGIEQLVQKQYFSFALGHNGYIKIKTGTEPHNLAKALGEPVSREQFSWMLNWLNKMALRDKVQHVFMGLRYVNLPELSQNLSTVALMAQIETFSKQLRALLRTTDVLCQYNDETLLFLLPKVNDAGLEVVKQKLAAIVEQQADNSLQLAVNIKTLHDSSLDGNSDVWLGERYTEMR